MVRGLAVGTDVRTFRSAEGRLSAGCAYLAGTGLLLLAWVSGPAGPTPRLADEMGLYSDEVVTTWAA